MITAEQLNALSVGDVIEAGLLIPGLQEEKLVWDCIEITNDSGETTAIFEVTYFGVRVSRFKAYTTKKSGVIFKEIK